MIEINLMIKYVLQKKSVLQISNLFFCNLEAVADQPSAGVALCFGCETAQIRMLNLVNFLVEAARVQHKLSC